MARINRNIFAERGRDNYEEEEYELGVENLSKAIKIEPKNSEHYYYRGICKLMLLQTKEGIQDINKAIKLTSTKNEKLYYLRATAFFKMGKYSESLNDYNTAIELGFRSAEIYNDRGKAKEELGLLVEANDDYLKAEQLIQKKLKQKEYEKEGQKRIEEEEKKLQQINLETVSSLKITSMNQVKKVLKISEKGISFFNQKNYWKALEIYEKLTHNMEYEDSYIEYFSNLFYNSGLCKYYLCHFKEALKDITFSLKLQDKFNRLNLGEKEESIEGKFDIVELQAEVYEKLGDYKSAIDAWSKFVNLFKFDPELGHEDPELSEEDFYIEACLNLARLKKMKGQLNAAFKHLFNGMMYIESWNNQYAEYSKNFIDLGTFLGKYDNVDYVIGRTLEIKSKNNNILSLQGEILIQQKQFKDALKIFKKIKKSDTKFPFIEQKLNRLILLEKKFSQFKFEGFERSAIINFKEEIVADEVGLRNQINHEDNIFAKSCDKYFSSNTKLNKYDDKVNWHIKDLQDFHLLLENLKRTIRFANYRSQEELCALMQLIMDKKIDLFIIKNTKESEKYVAKYNSKNNYIIINGDYFYDIDSMCISLTHEIIHYLQEDGIPLGIDIEDSLVELVNENYKDLSDKEFLHELEAWTYESVPYFVIELAKNRDKTISKHKVSRKRLKTIEWITNNRILPIYEYQSCPKKRIKLNY